MKRLTLALLLCFPLLLSAQLDKIQPGMTLEEFRAKFPKAERDYGAMTSYVYSPDAKANIKGVTTYTLSNDTVSGYWFQSQRVEGPCDKFPTADSTACSKILTAARTLLGHYTDLYGLPREKSAQSLLAPGGDANEVNVFFAKWKTASDEILVIVHRPGKSAEFSAANAYVRPERDVEAGCSYVFEVISKGKGRELKSEFGNGYSIAEFKTWLPYLAAQVKSYPDCWRIDDTVTAKNGEWKFQFTAGKLETFSFEVYDGSDYGRLAPEAYAALRTRAMQLASEAETSYGKADSASTKFPDKYKAPKDSKNYYSIVNYYSRWKKDGKSLVLELDEDGGGKQGPPVFRLVVTFAHKD